MSSGEEYYLKALFEKTKLKEVMEKPVLKVYEDDDVSDAEKIFVEKNIYYLPVVRRDNTLSGLISQRYLYKTLSPRRIIKHEEMDYDPNVIVDGDSFYEKSSLDSYILSSIMLHNPFSLHDDESLGKAVKEMLVRKINCIPVVDKYNKVVGVFTNRELVKFTAQAIS